MNLVSGSQWICWLPTKWLGSILPIVWTAAIMKKSEWTTQGKYMKDRWIHVSKEPVPLIWLLAMWHYIWYNSKWNWCIHKTAMCTVFQLPERCDGFQDHDPGLWWDCGSLCEGDPTRQTTASVWGGGLQHFGACPAYFPSDAQTLW